MNDEAAFLAAIAADPKDDLGYLVFADWLQEQGEEVRAGLVRDPKARAALGPTLADPFPELKTHLLAGTWSYSTRECFRAFGEAGVPTLLQVLAEADDPAAIANTVECAQELGPAGRELLPSIMLLLSHDDRTVRSRSWSAAGRIGFAPRIDEGSFEVLAAAIRSEDSSVRWTAVRVLGPDRIREKIFPALDRDRHSPDPEVRLGVLRALDTWGLPEARQYLPGFVADPSPRVRLGAVGALQDDDSTDVADLLVAALSDTDAEVRLAASRSIISYRSTSSWDSTKERLRLALRETDETVAVALAATLRRQGADGSPALPDLLAWLPLLTPDLWREFVHALLRIAARHPGDCAASIQTADDPEPVRAAGVVEPMRTCGGVRVETIESMLHLVEDSSFAYWNPQSATRQVLARIRPALPDALEALGGLLRDSRQGLFAFRDPFAILGEPALRFLPSIEARFLRSEPAGSMGTVLATLGQPGVDVLLRVLPALRHDRERAKDVVYGLVAAAKSSSATLLPTFREMLREYDGTTWMEASLCGAILGMGPAASVAVGDVVSHYHPGTNGGETARAIAGGFAGAFEGWLEGMAGCYRAPQRPGLYRGVLEVLRLLPPRPGHLRHAFEILEAVGEMHRLGIPVGATGSGADSLVKLVCESAIRSGLPPGPMAARLADIPAGRYCAPTALVNRLAVRAIGTVTDPKVVPILIPLLRHEDGVVAARAAISLGKMGSDDAVRALTFALGDSRPRVRRESARALNRIGSAYDTVLERLHALAEDDDPKVRKDAKRAHKVLAAKAARPARVPPPGGSP